MKLEFNEERHEYKVDDIVKPSLTQILGAVGIVSNYSNVDEKVLENSRVFGKAVHKACEIDEKEDISKYDIDEPVMHCVKQWRVLRDEIYHEFTYPDIKHIEEKMYCKTYDFCCTPDRVYAWLVKGLVVIVELKTGIDAKGADIQTVGQELAYRDNCGFKIKKVLRHTAHLYHDKPEGKLVPHTKKTDKNIFISAKNVYTYRKENGLL